MDIFACETQLLKFITEIPKVELHIHLEGAIPLQTLFQLIQKYDEDSTVQSITDLEKKLTYTDFSHFIDIWGWKNSFIQEERDFEEIAYQTLYELSLQNIKYIEAHYSPGDFRRQGFTTEGITEYLIKGKKKANRDFGIQCELLVDLVRDHGPDIGMLRLDEVTPYLNKGVIGIGLGGSEYSFPADPYAKVYAEAKNRGFRCTVHAGETSGPESIWSAIQKLGSERIGHAITAQEDPHLIAFLEERQIPLEISVISNIKTKVCKSIENHPIKQYYDKGLFVTINSDDPTMFNTSLVNEYLVLAQKLKFSINDIKQLTFNGIKASFMSNSKKNRMKDLFIKEWDSLFDKFS